MKSTIVRLIILFFIYFSLSSCGDTKEDMLRKKQNTLGSYGYDTGFQREIFVYIIDSCEYIGEINCQNDDILTHKGNCKFCQKRKLE